MQERFRGVRAAALEPPALLVEPGRGHRRAGIEPGRSLARSRTNVLMTSVQELQSGERRASGPGGCAQVGRGSPARAALLRTEPDGQSASGTSFASGASIGSRFGSGSWPGSWCGSGLRTSPGVSLGSCASGRGFSCGGVSSRVSSVPPCPPCSPCADICSPFSGTPSVPNEPRLQTRAASPARSQSRRGRTAEAGLDCVWGRSSSPVHL